MNESKQRLTYLDALRGLACLTVFSAHFLVLMPSIGVNASGTGKIGVWMFFVLSGFFVVYVGKDQFLTGGVLCKQSI